MWVYNIGIPLALLMRREVEMRGWIEKIIQDSKNRSIELNPKQQFYREFDRALQKASRPQIQGFIQDDCEKLEQLGLKAGLSQREMAFRKNLLLWTLSQSPESSS